MKYVLLTGASGGLGYKLSEYLLKKDYFVIMLYHKNDNVKELDIYGTSTNRVDGLKSLKVSTEAPFDDSTSPQINVSYTGLNRNALVELFNSLPTVSNGQTIDITGCTGTSSLTNDDKAIATNKGWTITGV